MQEPGPDPKKIELLVFDVDGVLTDGSITYTDRGEQVKSFYVRDGFAMRAADSFGLKVGVLTGRSSRALTLRVNEIGVELFVHGQNNKAIGIETMAQRAGVELDEIAYLGDDLLDLPAMVRVGYPMAVADATDEVRDVARYVTRAPGGRGAAREAIEHVLKAQGQWDAFLERFAE